MQLGTEERGNGMKRLLCVLLILLLLCLLLGCDEKTNNFYGSKQPQLTELQKLQQNGFNLEPINLYYCMGNGNYYDLISYRVSVKLTGIQYYYSAWLLKRIDLTDGTFYYERVERHGMVITYYTAKLQIVASVYVDKDSPYP